MHSSEPTVRSSATLARIDRLIARLPELDEQHLEGIEANLYELSELRARCTVCAYLYRPYLERARPAGGGAASERSARESVRFARRVDLQGQEPGPSGP